jgi:prophage DNA circulation protein
MANTEDRTTTRHTVGTSPANDFVMDVVRLAALRMLTTEATNEQTIIDLLMATATFAAIDGLRIENASDVFAQMQDRADQAGKMLRDSLMEDALASMAAAGIDVSGVTEQDIAEAQLGDLVQK